jgi:hypothetical protein
LPDASDVVVPPASPLKLTLAPPVPALPEMVYVTVVNAGTVTFALFTVTLALAGVNV